MNKDIKINLFAFLLNFFFTCDGQSIYINSIPKTGTHLLMKCVELITNRKVINIGSDLVTTNKLPDIVSNSILLFHIPFSLKATKVFKDNNFLCLFIYRDPRDCVISYAYWCLRCPHLLDELKINKNLPIDFPALISKIIYRINATYEEYIDWLNVPFYLGVKFEDLIGPQGGGNKTKQYETIKTICKHIKINPADSLIENCMDNLFGGTWSFREGKIGSWKTHFNDIHKELFKQVAGDLLIKLGYEKDLNW